MNAAAPARRFRYEVGVDTDLRGRLSFPGDARIDGRLRGAVEARALLVVGPQATLRAEVRAEHLVVQGTVIGRIRQSAMVEIESGGRVIADVEAERLVVKEGALLEGHCAVGRGRSAAAR